MIEHISGEDLAAYSNGALLGEARDAMEAHLSRCRECREELADIAALQGSRERVPEEFLRRALRVPGEGFLGKDASPVRKVMPLRQAFGIAAVFLVMVLAGYFFLGRDRLQMGKASEKVIRAEDRQDALKAQDAERSGKDSPAPSAHSQDKTVLGDRMQKERDMDSLALEERAEVADALKREGKTVSREAEPLMPAAPVTAEVAEPAGEKARQRADETETTQSGTVAEGIVGGVLDGVETAPKKEKANEVRGSSTAGAAPPSRGMELQRDEEAKLHASAPSWAKGAVQDQRRQSRHGPNAEDASTAVMQMLLAANGQAAAPMAIQALAPTAVVRIAGDVFWSDLLDPRQLASWAWLPQGLSLELEIAADGRVAAVTPRGNWDHDAAAKAAAAARKLAFRAAARKTRRAVLSADNNPN